MATRGRVLGYPRGIAETLRFKSTFAGARKLYRSKSTWAKGALAESRKPYWEDGRPGDQ